MKIKSDFLLFFYFKVFRTLATIHPLAPFSQQFFGGTAQLEVAAKNIFGVIEALDALAPGFADVAGLRATFAIDGSVQNDWSAAIKPDAEVALFPRVAGGWQGKRHVRWRTGCPHN